MTSYGFTLDLDEIECSVVEEALNLLIRNAGPERDSEGNYWPDINRLYAERILADLAAQKQRIWEHGSGIQEAAPTTTRKFRHIPGVTAEAHFSECRSYRYSLTLDRPESGGRCVCVIMQNPSVASADEADRTIQFLEKLIFEKGYPEFEDVGRVVVVNQFALVQTKDFEGSEEGIGPENDAHIREAVESADIVLVAWGKGNNYQERKAVVNAIIARSASKKLILQTKTHPSRGTYKDFVEAYN